VLQTSTSLPAVGGAASFEVETSTPDCQWPVTTDVSWIRIAVAGPGRGSDTVEMLIAPNSDKAARSGQVVIGQTAVTIQQAGNTDGSVPVCTFTLSQPPTVAHAGQELALDLTVSSADCTWQARSAADWAQVYPLSGTGTAKLAMKVYPSFSSLPRSTRLTAGGKQVQISQAGSPVALDDRFVGHLYFAFMGRYPTAVEIAFHVNEGLRKGMSRSDLVMNFLNSGEFNQAGRFVAGLYVGLLNRDAEFSGWLFQRNALTSNLVSSSQIVKNFIDSAEWGGKFGNPSVRQFIEQLYRYVLLRTPAQSEVDWHAANIASGQKREDLASNFLNSGEFRIGTGPRLTAFLLYATILSRAPTTQEFTQRVAELTAKRPVKAIIEEILAGSEMTDLLR
jgi:hypothetical protein